MNHDDILSVLRADRVVSEDAVLKPLTGGVSSEIYLVEDGGEKFVVKRALPKLKVEAEWFADVSRNKAERDYIEFVSRISPESVPRLISSGDGYFVMEYLGDEFVNWKQALLGWQFEIDWARQAGALLGKIHSISRDDESLAAAFDNMESFVQLRVDPYLVATAPHHPRLESLILEEAQRLSTHRSALVHGDFSPKNILISDDRLVLLDCEVACFADPAFDISFLFTHFLLKVLHHRSFAEEVRSMIASFIEAYGIFDLELEQRVTRLLPMLMLARIDGKSPVEYLVDESDRNAVRKFCESVLTDDTQAMAPFYEKWVVTVSDLHPR